MFTALLNNKYNKAMNKETNNNIKLKGIEDFKPNKEVLSALKEAQDILNGKVDCKTYSSFQEAVKDFELDD